jgi:hypothetical protein
MSKSGQSTYSWFRSQPRDSAPRSAAVRLWAGSTAPASCGTKAAPGSGAVGARGRPRLVGRPCVVGLLRRAACGRATEPCDPPCHACAPLYGQPVAIGVAWERAKADDCLVTSPAVRRVTKGLANSVCSAGGGKLGLKTPARRPGPQDLADLRTRSVTKAVQRDSRAATPHRCCDVSARPFNRYYCSEPAESWERQAAISSPAGWLD